MNLTAYQAASAAARDEMLSDLSPETRALVDEATAAYCAEMDRLREHEARQAARFAERQAAWAGPWEAAFRAACAQGL